MMRLFLKAARVAALFVLMVALCQPLAMTTSAYASRLAWELSRREVVATRRLLLRINYEKNPFKTLDFVKMVNCPDMIVNNDPSQCPDEPPGAPTNVIADASLEKDYSQITCRPGQCDAVGIEEINDGNTLRLLMRWRCGWKKDDDDPKHKAIFSTPCPLRGPNQREATRHCRQVSESELRAVLRAHSHDQATLK